jgi:hypothetical protein
VERGKKPSKKPGKKTTQKREEIGMEAKNGD